MSEPRTFSIRDTKIRINCETEGEPEKAFKRVQLLLRRNGFTVEKDPRIEKNYTSLSKYHRVANHGELKCKIEYSRIGVEVEFYQSIVFDNPSGGEYDFDKLKKMPYLIRLRFQWTVEKFREHLRKHGFTEELPSPRYTEDPLAAFNDDWAMGYERKHGVLRFNRGPDGWPSEDVLRSWHRTDADGVVVNSGQTRYCIVRGRSFRCKVYGGINGMWICVYGPGPSDLTSVHASRLYSNLPCRGRFMGDYDKGRRMKAALQKALSNKDYLRAHAIKTAIEKSQPERKEASLPQ